MSSLLRSLIPVLSDSGDFGEFASFVSHMKQIAEVIFGGKMKERKASNPKIRKKMLISFWLIPETFMMVSCLKSSRRKNN